MQNHSLRAALVYCSFALVVAASLGSLSCDKKDSGSDSTASKPSAAASAPAGAKPTATTSSATAAPGGDKAARKAEYCKRHDALKKLTSPGCQSCLTKSPKAMATCQTQANAFKACEKTVAAAKRQQTMTCMVGCGLSCNCSLDCYEKGMPECLEAYIASMDCVTNVCEPDCK